ncbi:unnamed protein product [Auanema sp. JU1783]|nr:unnamed protein product [Auanema sp. JU1783]
MTQLNGSDRVIFGNPMNNHNTQSSSQPRYYVNEPLGKRPACHHTYSDILEGAPRAKRRIEKVNSYLQNLSLSQNLRNPTIIESSSDEEMLEEDRPTCSTNAIVEEPEENSSIKLNDQLLKYIALCKNQPDEILRKINGPARGDEVTIWRPVQSRPEHDLPNMAGRIREIDDEEELPEEVDDVCVSFPDDTSPEMSPYSRSSLSTSPTPQIVELTDSSASSPAHMMENDFEMDTD